MKCLLCQNITSELVCDVFQCSHCQIVFKNPLKQLSRHEDFERYSNHQNTIQDTGYIHFLNRLLIPLKEFLPPTFKAIDFGCGPGPTLSLLLKDLGGEVSDYDPLFYPDQKLLDEKYDIVTSTEVVEHFKNPLNDWRQLCSLVQENGILGVMTQFFNESVDYQTWWYKNDPTHLVFYNEINFQWIANEFGLDIIFNDHKSIIIFRKK